MSEVIDLTPEHLKTPEGAKRINAALTKGDEANATCARILCELVQNYGLFEWRTWRTWPEIDPEGEFREEIERVLAGREEAQRELYQAIAGR